MHEHHRHESAARLRGLTRKLGCLTIVLVAFAGTAYADGGEGGDHGDNGTHSVAAPEFGTSSAVTACLLAAGGLLLLADRARRSQMSSSGPSIFGHA